MIERLNAALEARYRIERELGEGGMATVYLAEDLKHQRKVAVKVLRPELAAMVGGERFLVEIRTTAALQHPHILPLHDSGEADGFLFYVMPYVEGESLRERLDRERQLPVGEAVEIARKVADALDYAHEQGVVHRDVKPANVLISGRGEPLVADFGIALAVSQAGGGRLTETGLSLGTPYYMSPEQATAERDPGPRSDVYSLACVVYEMLTGEPPFTGRSAQAVVSKILTDTVEPPSKLRPTVPRHVDAAVGKALRKIPADRFGTAAEFGDALNEPSFALADSEAAAAASRSSRGLWNPLSAAATAVAAGLLAFTVWSAIQPDPSTPVRRYSLALPASEALDRLARPRLGLSPDGDHLAYIGPGPQGIPRLWVRPRDQLNATPLPGTEGAAVPFFSPDGARIGFLRRPLAGGQQSVEFASLTGGPSVTLVNDRVGLDGAAWGADGFIYYDGITGAGTTGIMRVSERGGAPEQVTAVDTARGETDHVWPHVLPRARGLLFTILRGSELERADVAVLDFETGETRVLVRAVRGRYADPGHILFVRADGALGAMPFDARRLEPGGEVTRLADGVSVRINGSVDLELSRSGTLVYATGEQALELRELFWIDREGHTAPADPEWIEDFRTLSLSPDGARVAVSISTVGWGGDQDIYVKQLPDGPMSRLTVTEDVQNHRPVWTPDGRAITFLSNRAGEADVYRLPADGSSPPERVVDGTGAITEVSHTRDGQWLVYAQEGDLFAVSTDGESDPVPLVTTPAWEAGPEVSPDGRWLAYTSNESGRYHVYVSPFSNTSRARHTVSTINTAEGFDPLWNHDGSELFYKTTTGDLVAVKLAPGESFRIEEREVLFPLTPLQDWRGPARYDAAPDGRRFLTIQDRNNLTASEIIVVDGFDQVLRERMGN